MEIKEIITEIRAREAWGNAGQGLLQSWPLSPLLLRPLPRAICEKFKNFGDPTLQPLQVLKSREEKERWLFHLGLAANGATQAAGTPFEQLIQRLMAMNGGEGSFFGVFMACFIR